MPVSLTAVVVSRDTALFALLSSRLAAQAIPCRRVTRACEVPGAGRGLGAVVLDMECVDAEVSSCSAPSEAETLCAPVVVLTADGGDVPPQLLDSPGFHSVVPRDAAPEVVAAVVRSAVRSARLALIADGGAGAERGQDPAARMAVVSELARALATTVDVEAICRIAAVRIGRILDVAHLAITEYDAEREVFRLLYLLSDGVPVDVSGLPDAPLDPDAGPHSRAILSGAPVITWDLQARRADYTTYVDVETKEEDRGRDTRAVLTVPIVVDRGPLGTLQIQSYHVGAYSEEDASLLSGIAGELGLALANARLVARANAEAQRLLDVVQAVPAGVVVLDAGGEVLMSNPAADDALGYLAECDGCGRLERLGGKPWRHWLAPLPSGQRHELTAPGGDGTTGDAPAPLRRFEVASRPVAGSAQGGAHVLVIRDVTEARVAQARIRQQERLAAVGQLAAGIAHDFNNIMAVIVLYAQMGQADRSLPVRTRKRMATIVEQAHHAGQLIDQILDFSRSTALERHPLDLLSFLKEFVRLLRRTLPEAIDVSLDYDHGAYTILGDPTRIQQAVMNLALNARDAMPDGGRLTLTLSRLDVSPDTRPPLPELGPGAYVILRVGDTGSGIPADVLPRIFDPFFTTKGPERGNGLGLAQVHGIIKQHEGEIEVQTQLGRGTTFTLYFPAVVAPQGAAPGAPEGATLPHGAGQTILVVDDNDATRASLVASLEMLNYRTLTACNGREALARYDADPDGLDLILTDMGMPVLGGGELIRILADRGCAVPVVVITGYSVADASLAALIRMRLPKPVDLSVLAETLQGALRSS